MPRGGFPTIVRQESLKLENIPIPIKLDESPYEIKRVNTQLLMDIQNHFKDLQKDLDQLYSEINKNIKPLRESLNRIISAIYERVDVSDIEIPMNTSVSNKPSTILLKDANDQFKGWYAGYVFNLAASIDEGSWPAGVAFLRSNNLYAIFADLAKDIKEENIDSFESFSLHYESLYNSWKRCNDEIDRVVLIQHLKGKCEFI